MKQKILFDHFMDGIEQAAHNLYDLHPLVCKKFSSVDVINLFRQFESKVSEKDPFWMKSDKLMFINGEGKLETLNLQNEIYFILNEGYCTDRSYDFLNPTMHAFFCPSSQEGPLWESYQKYYDGTGVCLKYHTIAHREFKHYGENFYMKNIRPHTDIFKDVIVEIFGLKKFPENVINKNKLEDLEFSITYRLEHEEYCDYVEAANEYLDLAKSVCPDLENNPAYLEIISLNDEFTKLVDRAKATKEDICKKIIPKVKASV